MKWQKHYPLFMHVTEVVLVDVWFPIVVHEIVNASVTIVAVFCLGSKLISVSLRVLTSLNMCGTTGD